MGITDKVPSAVKKAAGDLTGSASTRREGLQEERSAEAREEAARAEELAEQKRREASRVGPEGEAEAGRRP